MNQQSLFKILFCALFLSMFSCATKKNKEIAVGYGWSNNSINTVKFRKNALTSFKNFQFIAYYDADGSVVLGKRKLKSNNWEIVKTAYTGNVKDAHNSISIAIDGDGYLHVSWDHHDTKLKYAKSKLPLSLQLGEEESMTGITEQKVTYPEFYSLPNGNLLFFYRSGSSGRGNMVINSYDIKQKKWLQLQSNLIDGENQRSAYWQANVDTNGTIHLSWVWRESWDVSTNHDICYAFSPDGGKTWQKSTGEKYVLPITEATAEHAWNVAQDSSLINQTSMTLDNNGNPFIASYWDNNGIPQYKVVYLSNGKWNLIQTDFHLKAFTLGGGGTKKIPISRPEVLVNNSMLYLLFRDEERDNKITLGSANLENQKWELTDLSRFTVGQWEPNFDKELWRAKKQLHIFSQNVSQEDGEGLAKADPQMVKVLEVKKLPEFKL